MGSDDDSDDDVATASPVLNKIKIDNAVKKQVAKTKAAITTVSKSEKKAKEAVK